MTAATSLREDLLRYDPIVLFHRGNPFHCGEDQFRHEDTLLQDGGGLLRLRHEFLCVRNDFLCHRENRDREPLFLVCGLPRQDVVPVSCVQMQPGDFAVFPLKHHNGIVESESIVAEILKRLRRGSRNLSIGERDLVSADSDAYDRGLASTFSDDVSGELSQVTHERKAPVGRFP